MRALKLSLLEITMHVLKIDAVVQIAMNELDTNDDNRISLHEV